MEDLIFCTDPNHDERVNGDSPAISRARLVRYRANKITVRPVCDKCAPHHRDLMPLDEAIRLRDAQRPKPAQKVGPRRRQRSIKTPRPKPRTIEPRRQRVNWGRVMRPFRNEAEGRGCSLRHRPGKCSIPGCRDEPWALTFRSNGEFPLCRVHANASWRVFLEYEAKGIIFNLFRSRKLDRESVERSSKRNQPTQSA
jgi:hypothetical protein